MIARKFIVEPGDGALLGMDESGNVYGFSAPQGVLRYIARRDRAESRRGQSTVTTIEWRDMPEGFEVPTL